MDTHADLGVSLQVVLTDCIDKISHPYPTAEWVGYSHGAMIAHCREVHATVGLGGVLAQEGTPEAGWIGVADAAGAILIDYEWETVAVEA